MPSQIETDLLRYINLKLAALGQPTSRLTADPGFQEIAGPLLRNYRRKDQLLKGLLCPADARVQTFLDTYLADVCPSGAPRLPDNTFVLDRPGMARSLSLPPGADAFVSPYLHSYRVPQGVLHNPKSDRRTTKGLFHIVDGGLPVPGDKIEMPRCAFAVMLAASLRPPADVLALPFTADQAEQARLLVSLLLRPLVCPATARDPAKTMELRFFVPGSLVSNLDFVEGIFGNAGDPFLPENDAALDIEHWTGHTGWVILAPHLVGIPKKSLGLPRFEDATGRQRRDGMCWRDEQEPYNGGHVFKLACRDRRGVMVTIIADNYYGYCKKEVKTQISFAANLFGLCEEEHAGGAVALPSYVLGQDFYGGRTLAQSKKSLDAALVFLGDRAERKPEGYAVDRNYPSIFYVPGDAEFSVQDGLVRWHRDSQTSQLTLRVGDAYFLPSGYRIWLEKQAGGTAWRLVSARPDGTLCHKPCTVSGGGKSEISKSIAGALLRGPIFVKNYSHDLEQVAEILAMDFSLIYRNGPPNARSRRPILSPERSLGSVIKLLNASPEYTDAHNQWVRALPQTIRQLVFTAKRYYRPEWGDRWREHFTVDRIDGFLGHELKYDNQRLVSNYLRVGYDPDGAWRIYKLRPDFHPAEKVQMEDDITASVVMPAASLVGLDAAHSNPSVKLVSNCEALLFQRPDDAVHPGFDKQAEADIASPGTFLSNFEPLTVEQARALIDHVVEFDRYTAPMQKLLKDFAAGASGTYVVSSAHARLVDGVPSKNPRYLQKRPDKVAPRATYLAEIGARLHRGVPANCPVYFPVDAVLAGRRNNPADPAAGLPPLAVYSPIHYQELPELFMDFVCSLTGKSPSTTGFGSEGALTKGPFNALWPVVDLNNALVSYILTGYAGFTTSAGYVGPHYKVDHDISMLVPEIWCRMQPAERDPRPLIEKGYLEKVPDLEYEGRKVPASRLGYRITARFAEHFLGRIFETPDAVFPDDLLRPETQDLATFVAGVESIVEAQKQAANNYFEDGSVEAACPPLKAILHIMAHGTYEGMTLDDARLRAAFTRESLLASDWYGRRLRAKQERDMELWRRHAAAVEGSAIARQELARVSAPAYLEELTGTIGADPFGD